MDTVLKVLPVYTWGHWDSTESVSSLYMGTGLKVLPVYKWARDGKRYQFIVDVWVQG